MACQQMGIMRSGVGLMRYCALMLRSQQLIALAEVEQLTALIEI